MRAITRVVLTLLSAMALTIGLVGASATAHPSKTLTATPTAAIQGSRVVVKFTGKKPSKVVLVVAGQRYSLSKSGKSWRTKKLSASTLAALSGAKAKIKARIGGKQRTLKTTIAGTTTPPPAPPAPTPLFVAPGVDSSGQAAWDAIKGYFLDSTFTNCVQGWGPSCFSEERYGHFANFTQVYCRLTSAPGADITNYPKPMYVYADSAEQKANGAWGVSYFFDYGDGQDRFYTWFVQPDGSVSGRYWYNVDPRYSPPTEEISGLTWIRGAKDCTY